MPTHELLDMQALAATHFPRNPGAPEITEVPASSYLMIDGMGDPETSVAFTAALNWLYGVSYSLKFAAKALGRDFRIGWLEGLWWSANSDDFVSRLRDRWNWTLMIAQPDFVSAEQITAAIAKVAGKLGTPPASLRLARYGDGLCAQVLHIGPFADEGAVLSRLHREYMPAQGLRPAGSHHEIYLDAPRRVIASKRRTVLRQPVERVAVATSRAGAGVDKAATLA